jgi:hypothetical protein
MRYRLFFFAVALVALGIGGCAGEGTSSDPLGTDSLTFGDSSGGTVLSLDTNGVVQLTATVKDAAGKGVADREVSFGFVANASGATLTPFSKVNTNPAGEAKINYQAGGTPGRDIVRAFLSNGAVMDVTITVGGGVPGVQISLAAAPSTLAAEQSSIITATVTNAAGAPVRGQAVSFAFAANNSGAILTILSGITDISGRAVALYRAGKASPAAEVEDIILGSVAGSVSPAVITRTAVGGLQISLTGEPTSLSAGQNSIITATVTDGTGSPVTGETVTFAFAANNSGATLTILSGTTDVSGRAIAMYTAGSANPTASVQDTVQASVAGSVGAVVITRGTGGMTLSIASSVASLAAGQMAVITATVTDGASAPVSGQAVTFAFAANNSGATLTTLSGTTDVSGKAVAQYTAGANNPTAAVQDTVLASVPGSAAAVTITRTVGIATGLQMSVTATPSSLAAGAPSIVVAQVSNADATPAPGKTVSFSFVNNSSGATLAPINGGVTDVSGRALAIYTAGANNPTANVQDTLLARATGTAAAVVITRTAGTAAGFQIDVTSSNPRPNAGEASIIIATLRNADGSFAAGQPVTFSFVNNSSGATLTILRGTTDVSGKALAIYTAGANNPTASVQDVVLAQATGTAAVVIITRQAAAGTGNRISSLTAAPPALFAPAGTSAVTATVVGADNVTPVSGVTVSFSVVTGVGTVTPTAVTGNDGKAVAVFAGTGAAVGAQSVVQAVITGGTAVAIITWQ